MKRSADIKVDDRNYLVTQYMATRGQQLFVRLAKLFGKSVGLIADQTKEKGSFLDVDITSVIESALLNLEPEASTLLIKEILVGTQIHDSNQVREINYDLDFAGRYLHLFKLLKEILAFQYSDFLGGLASRG